MGFGSDALGAQHGPNFSLTHLDSGPLELMQLSPRSGLEVGGEVGGVYLDLGDVGLR